MTAHSPDAETLAPQSCEDREWLTCDLSRLDDEAPYDWGDCHPLDLGHPIHYESGKGFVIEGVEKSES